jgi:hypothetical protein
VKGQAGAQQSCADAFSDGLAYSKRTRFPSLECVLTKPNSVEFDLSPATRRFHAAPAPHSQPSRFAVIVTPFKNKNA